MRLFFSDMDGTFLADDKSVPFTNMRALDAVFAHGDRFVPCTGRLFAGIPRRVLEHPSVRFAISSNGACVSQLIEGSWRLIASWPMEFASMKAAADLVQGMDLSTEYFTNNHVYVPRAQFDLERFFGGTSFYQYALETRLPFDGTLEQLVERHGPIYRMNLRTRSAAVTKQALDRLRDIRGVTLTSSIPFAVDITVQGATKGAAACWLAEHTHCVMSEAVAFGDADNDSTLLSAVGDGVAVRGADREALRAARHTTLTNDEAGVGAYIIDLYKGGSNR